MESIIKSIIKNVISFIDESVEDAKTKEEMKRLINDMLAQPLYPSEELAYLAREICESMRGEVSEKDEDSAMTALWYLFYKN
jgi:hypothetical protein